MSDGMPVIRQWRTTPAVLAECTDCHDFMRDVTGTSDSKNARAAAKRHAQVTGHTVRVERTITTYFEANRAR